MLKHCLSSFSKLFSTNGKYFKDTKLMSILLFLSKTLNSSPTTNSKVCTNLLESSPDTKSTWRTLRLTWKTWNRTWRNSTPFSCQLRRLKGRNCSHWSMSLRKSVSIQCYKDQSVYHGSHAKVLTLIFLVELFTLLRSKPIKIIYNFLILNIVEDVIKSLRSPLNIDSVRKFLKFNTLQKNKIFGDVFSKS